VYGTVLDNQKAVTVRGTFLQNARYAQVFYQENYTDIEMEAGPYLSAAFELARPKRHPRDEIVNLHNVPFDIGFLHYASDTPLSKGQNRRRQSLVLWDGPNVCGQHRDFAVVFELEIDRVNG
jgi:hypothetical protein